METFVNRCFTAWAFLSLAVQIHAATSIGSVSRGFRFSAAEAADFSPFLLSGSREFAAGFLRDSRTGYFALAVVGVDGGGSDTDQLRRLDTVWIANRNDPFRGTPELVFRNDTGVLVVNVQQQAQWDSSSSSTSNGGDTLQLSDAGNLMLLSGRLQSSNNVVVWQSFDHPTDTLLQGQNFTQSMSLVSSVSAQDPRSGPYSLKLQDDRILLLAGTEPYWSDAALKERDNGTANSSIYMRIQPDGYFGLYQSDNRVHFVPFSSFNRTTANFTRRARVDPDGNLRVYYFQNGSIVNDYSAIKNPCEFPSSCGSYGICSSSELQNKTCKCPDGASAATNASLAFIPVDPADPTRGCSSDFAASRGECNAGSEPDDFLVIRGVDYFANKYPGAASAAASLGQCRDLCLASCSCQAFFFRNDSSACFLTSSLRSMVDSPNPSNLGFIRISRRRSGRRRHIARALEIVVALLAAISAAAICGLCYYCSKKARKSANAGEDNGGHSDQESFLAVIPGLPRRFLAAEMESAKSARRICAVQLQESAPPREFQAELAAIARLGRHPNLVPLLGYCIDGRHRYVVYENPGGRSLDEILKNFRDLRLDWRSRATILLGIARGLAFLHGNSIVHGDLAPASILLDESSKNPRLARYGVAALMGRGRPLPVDDVRAFGAIILAFTDGADTPSEADQRLREVGMWCSQQQPPPSMSLVEDTISAVAPRMQSLGIHS